MSLDLAFAGDLAIAGEFLAKKRPNYSSLAYPLMPLDEILTGIDGIVVNLEGPLGRDGEKRRGITSHIHNEEDVVGWLQRFPLCVCSLANNHMSDYGAEMLNRTRQRLGEASIYSVGAGRDSDEAASPLVVETKGLTLGFLNYTTNAPYVGSVLAGIGQPGSASFEDRDLVLKTVETNSRKVDSLVVSFHWGHEYYRFPTPDQISFGRKVIDAGATLVIGHHPHVQQGIEKYRHGLIAYSLGNLILPEFRLPSGRVQYRKPYTKQFSILRAQISRRRVDSWKILGGRCQKDYRLRPYAGREALDFENEMAELSEPLAKEGYSEYWERYRTQRAKELKKEMLRDSMAKLWMADWTTLIRHSSGADFKRLVGRLGHWVGRSSVQFMFL